jgi:hypothetical protein
MEVSGQLHAPAALPLYIINFRWLVQRWVQRDLFRGYTVWARNTCPFLKFKNQLTDSHRAQCCLEFSWHRNVSICVNNFFFPLCLEMLFHFKNRQVFLVQPIYPYSHIRDLSRVLLCTWFSILEKSSFTCCDSIDTFTCFVKERTTKYKYMKKVQLSPPQIL